MYYYSRDTNNSQQGQWFAYPINTHPLNAHPINNGGVESSYRYDLDMGHLPDQNHHYTIPRTECHTASLGTSEPKQSAPSELSEDQLVNVVDRVIEAYGCHIPGPSQQPASARVSWGPVVHPNHQATLQSDSPGHVMQVPRDSPSVVPERPVAPISYALSMTNRPQKRLHIPEPDLGEGPSQWMAESEDRGGVDPPNTRPTKRRRMTIEERETGVRTVAQRGETQELRAGRTPEEMKTTSKLGNIRLGKETPLAPLQGLYSPFPLGITGATPGPTEFQAWTGRSWHTSDETEVVHEEDESVTERCVRLMHRDGDRWQCRGCPRKTFHDRPTLRRHCKTVHGRECDKRKCPLCPDKAYVRKSGLDRHMKGKHPGGE